MNYTRLNPKLGHLIFISKNNFKNLSVVPTLKNITVEVFGGPKSIKTQKFLSYAAYSLFGLKNQLSSVKTKIGKMQASPRILHTLILTTRTAYRLKHAQQILLSTNLAALINPVTAASPQVIKRLMYGVDRHSIKSLEGALLQKNINLRVAVCLTGLNANHLSASYMYLYGLDLK